MNKDLKVVLLALVIVCPIGAGLYGFAYLFAPGSYPFAEEYLIHANESALIKSIQDFKKNNPQYIVPEQTQLADGRSNEKDHWYHVYFYYPVENEIVYAWTRPYDSTTTTFALVGINKGLVLGNWKEINDDFSRTENRKQKKKFEERILNEIKESLLEVK